MTFLGFKYLPWILLALVLAAVAFFWAMHVRRVVIKRLAGDASKSSIRTTASPLRRKLRTAAVVASLLAVAVTLLRPIGGMVLTENRLPAKNLIILFDASKSMGVTDSEGLTRLEAAKLFAREFINSRPADRIGLVSFDGVAFPECPATLSRTMLLSRIDIQRAGGLPVQGSNLPGALAEASNLLTEEPPPGSAIILLSDGDRLTDDPAGAGAAISEKGVPLFAVYFGNPSMESPIPDSELQSRADPEIMRKLAEATGGIHISGATSVLDNSLRKLNDQIDTMKIDTESDFAANLQNRPLELYAYPLAIALGCLLLRFFIPARTGGWHHLAPSLAAGLFFLTLTQNDAVAQEAAPEPQVYQPFVEAMDKARELDRPLLVLFTGSDWSEASIKFETEILSHETYQNWEQRAVVPLLVDLPRSGIDPDERRARRALASRLGVRSFPTAVFLDETENELGRLAHDNAGPASWVRRADLIIAGERAASTSESKVEQLPDAVKQSLEEAGLTSTERAIRYYNQAMSFRKMDPELAKSSPDRFKLLDDLLGTAGNLIPDSRPDLAADISGFRAVLSHERGLVFLPPEDMGEEAVPQIPGALAAPPQIDAKKALKTFRNALAHYRDTARLDSERDDLTPNLSQLQRDMQRAQDIIDFQKAYQDAIDKTEKILTQETAFRNSLDRFVTTALPVNDEDLEGSKEAIEELVRLGKIVKAPMLEDFEAADEDIRLAPDPHGQRGLHESVVHVQNAYDHLIEELQQQSQPQSGEGSGEPREDEQDGEGEGEEEDQRPQQNGGEQDLRRSQNGSGDLRERQLDALGRGNRPGGGGIRPGEDH